MRPIAERVVDGLAGRDRAELMADYLEPVSVLSLGTVLGVAHLGADRLRDWFWRLHQGVINFEGNPGRAEIGVTCSREIDTVLGPVFDRLEAAGDDSTISHLLHSGMPGGACRAREFVMPTLKVILLGGMQEPGHGGGFHAGRPAFAPRPARPRCATIRRACCQRRLRRACAGCHRSARRPARWRRTPNSAGSPCRRGVPVGSLVSSANRDGTKFADPDRFDIFRPRSSNLAFGAGRHFCAGHAFSRAQVRIAIEVLIRRFPGLALDPARPPVFRGWEFRAPRRLDVLL